MKIDLIILDRIRRYYAGELSQVESSELENQMDKDGKYAFHERFFRITSKSINTSDKQWIEKLDAGLHLKGDHSINLKSLKKKDRRRTNLFRLSLAASVLILIAIFNFYFWSSHSDQIYAGKPDDDELGELGATGVERGSAIEVKAWRIAPEGVDLNSRSIDFSTLRLFDSGRRQTITIYSAGTPALLHDWANDTLNLFSAEPENIEKSNILFMFIGDYNEKILFLKIGLNIYDVEYRPAAPTPLRESNFFIITEPVTPGNFFESGK